MKFQHIELTSGFSLRLENRNETGFSHERKEVMSYVKVWIHAVWGTKNHEPVLSKDTQKGLFRHIKENAKEKEIYIDFINGHVDHVHCL